MLEQQTIRLCMIGAGNHASKNIYPNFHRMEGAQVIANCDLDRARAEEQARHFNIGATYIDYREMIEKEKPDGVLVCVEPGFHGKVAPEIMRMGSHIYTEKPTCATLDQARTMLRTSEETGKICMTGFKKRFAPCYTKAKRIMESEEFGAPSMLRMLRTRGNKGGPTDGDYLLHWGCHAIDLVTYFYGKVLSVSGVMTREASAYQSIVLGMTFENGAVGSLDISDRPGAVWEEVDLIGQAAHSIRIVNAIQMTHYYLDQPRAAHHPSWAHGATLGCKEQGFSGELQAFVDAIRSGRAPEAGIAQTAHTMALYEAIRRALNESGTQVTVVTV